MKHTPRLMTALTAIVALAILSVVGFQQPAAATIELSWPCEGSIVLPFGDTCLASPRFHRGIDIAAPEGAEVKSPISGTVRFAGFTPAGGGTVSIDAGGGWRITLLQLENIAVRAGDQVVAGKVLGRVAASGDASSSEAHIHLGLIDPNGTYQNPAAFLSPQISSSGRGSANESAAVQVESGPASPAGELEGAGTLVAATDRVRERAGDPVSTQIEPYAEPSFVNAKDVVLGGVVSNQVSCLKECGRSVFPDRESVVSSEYSETLPNERGSLLESAAETCGGFSIPNLHGAEDRSYEQVVTHSQAHTRINDYSSQQTETNHESLPLRNPTPDSSDPLMHNGPGAHSTEAFWNRESQASSQETTGRTMRSGSEQDFEGAVGECSSSAESVAVAFSTGARASRGAIVELPRGSCLSPPTFVAEAREEGCGSATRQSSRAPFASALGWESALCGVVFLALLAVWRKRKGVTSPVLQRYVVAAEPA